MAVARLVLGGNVASRQLLAQELQVHQLEPGWCRVMPGVGLRRGVVVDFVRQRVVRELVARLCREVLEVLLTNGVLRVDVAGDRVGMLRLLEERRAGHMLVRGRGLLLLVVMIRQRLQVVGGTGLLVVGDSRLLGLVLKVEENLVAGVAKLAEHFFGDVGVHGVFRRGLVERGRKLLALRDGVVLRDVGLAAVDDDPVHRLRAGLLLLQQRRLVLLVLLCGRRSRLRLRPGLQLGELRRDGDDRFLKVRVGEHLGLLVVRITLVQLVGVLVGGAHLVARVLSGDFGFPLGSDLIIDSLFLRFSFGDLS